MSFCSFKSWFVKLMLQEKFLNKFNATRRYPSPTLYEQPPTGDAPEFALPPDRNGEGFVANMYFLRDQERGKSPVANYRLNFSMLHDRHIGTTVRLPTYGTEFGKQDFYDFVTDILPESQTRFPKIRYLKPPEKPPLDYTFTGSSGV